MRNEARMRDGLATPRYWWVQAKIIGIDGGYNSDPEYIPPLPPSSDSREDGRCDRCEELVRCRA